MNVQDEHLTIYSHYGAKYSQGNMYRLEGPKVLKKPAVVS
jgi:hypothetical protein